MTEDRNRLLVLVLIMTLVAAVVGGVTLGMLYHGSFEEQRNRLVESARQQARLMEAVARFDQVYSNDYPEGATKATLSQILDALSQSRGLDRTGELVLARREGDWIVFVSPSRHLPLEELRPLPWHSELAEPMRRALSGQSGSLVGLDYRGVTVLAAHEPVAVLGLGLVAKIDLAEIRHKFVAAGLLAAAVALVVILGGVGAFFAVSNPLMRHIRANEERLRLLSTHLERVREQEQKRISRELHDDLGGILTRLRMVLAAGRRSCPEQEAGGLQVQEAFGLAGQAMETLRRITASLRPKILDQLGVLAALEWLAQRFSQHFQVACLLDPDSVNVRLGEERETALFRIAQEGLTNVAKHAGAQRVSLYLGMDDNDVILRVTDDGAGITPEAIMNVHCMGIQGMMERSKQLNGSLRYVTSPRGGTILEARIPRRPGDREEEE
ncbi:MAG: sensor histidine kinase [Magnetococcales bacterium]|nr:sensor histidine kinase [Magnetococcales bacterium]